MRSSGIRTLVDATPDTRDRTVDLVRAGAIVLVVTGHWLAVTVSVDDGRLTGGNVLALVPAVQPLTWVVQVMPLFFLVGGWATAASWRSSVARGTATVVWLRARLDRLLRPTAGFVLVGAAATRLAGLAGAGGRRRLAGRHRAVVPGRVRPRGGGCPAARSRARPVRAGPADRARGCHRGG